MLSKKIIFKGTPGHGSMPYGSDNAVVKAAQAIVRIQNYCDNKIPITTDYVSDMVNGMGIGKSQNLMLTPKAM